jgi:hypothetical protein
MYRGFNVEMEGKPKVGWATVLSLPNILVVGIEMPMGFSNVIYMF